MSQSRLTRLHNTRPHMSSSSQSIDKYAPAKELMKLFTLDGFDTKKRNSDDEKIIKTWEDFRFSDFSRLSEEPDNKLYFACQIGNYGLTEGRPNPLVNNFEFTSINKTSIRKGKWFSLHEIQKRKNKGFTRDERSEGAKTCDELWEESSCDDIRDHIAYAERKLKWKQDEECEAKLRQVNKWFIENFANRDKKKAIEHITEIETRLTKAKKKIKRKERRLAKEEEKEEKDQDEDTIDDLEDDIEEVKEKIEKLEKEFNDAQEKFRSDKKLGNGREWNDPAVFATSSTMLTEEAVSPQLRQTRIEKAALEEEQRKAKAEMARMKKRLKDTETQLKRQKSLEGRLRKDAQDKLASASELDDDDDDDYDDNNFEQLPSISEEDSSNNITLQVKDLSGNDLSGNDLSGNNFMMNTPNAQNKVVKKSSNKKKRRGRPKKKQKQDSSDDDE